MKKIIASVTVLCFFMHAGAQNADKVINRNEVERIEKILSSDEMQGREAGKPGIDKAASFIEEEFRKAGLQPLPGTQGFKQAFSMVSPQASTISGTVNKQTIKEGNVIVFTSQPLLQVNDQSGYQKVFIKKGDNLGAMASKYAGAKSNLLVLVDPAFSNNFSRLNRLKEQRFVSDKSVIFMLTDQDPSTFDIKATHNFNTVSLTNIAGMIPGRSKKEEYVIFSGHYDHLGIGAAVDGDSIFNGANDDAAGTTAMIMLANYFKQLGNNERSLIFVAFTAEESGGFGSQYFSEQLDPSKVVAMFNIEMIGTESKWGKNTAFITGFDETNMGKIMQDNLKGSGFTFYPDPYPTLQLFYRSDNATLARQGVPAHTISTSKMDNEKFYHTQNDEIETLDLDNMAMIIKSIAISAQSIISGKDTPTRVNTAGLK